MLCPHPAGKFPVDHGVGALELAVCLFKVYVKGVRCQVVPHGEGHHLPVHPDQAALQPQLMVVLHGGAQSDSLISQVPLLRLPLPLKGAEIPLLIHLQTLRQAGRGDGLVHPGGIVLHKPVDVVALGVELLAAQVRQAVDFIQVVVAVPVGNIVKPAGEELLQLRHLPPGHAHQAQRPAPAGCILLQRPDGPGNIPGAGGVHIAASHPPAQMGHHKSAHPADLQAVGLLPDKHVGEIVITAPVAAPGQQFIHPGLVRRHRRVKVNHTNSDLLTPF